MAGWVHRLIQPWIGSSQVEFDAVLAVLSRPATQNGQKFLHTLNGSVDAAAGTQAGCGVREPAITMVRDGEPKPAEVSASVTNHDPGEIAQIAPARILCRATLDSCIAWLQ